jgi:prepilin-type processing-associated H-X9-DG protein
MTESNNTPPWPLNYESPSNRPKRLGVFFFCIGLASLVVLMFFIVAPNFNKVRALDPRIVSAGRLRSIGQAILLYENDFHGNYPDSLSTVYENEGTYIDSSIFVNPASNDTPASGPTTQAIAKQLTAGGHLSYVYVGAGLTVSTVKPDTVIAYEILQNPGDGSNVLFGDGRVDYVDHAHIAVIIARTKTGPFPVTMPSP